MRGRADIQSHFDERAQAGAQEARSASRAAGSFKSRRRLGMEARPKAATKFTVHWPLRILLFLMGLREIKAAPARLVLDTTLREGDTHALLLSYNFSITSQARPEQPWCTIQGQVNGNEFLSYDCQNKEVKPVGPLGMKLKDTASWGTQRETLEYLVEEFRKRLLYIKAEIVTKSDAVTMQGRLLCERGADRHTRVSWQFGFNEQITHLLDPENRKWTVVPPGGQKFNGTLDSDGELTELLVRTSKGDCQSWIQQVSKSWDETQKSTAPPTKRQDAAPGRATTVRHGTWIFPLLLSCAVIIGVRIRDH